MAEFRNRILQGLDALYGFVSQKASLNTFELEQAITPVHDVGRMAELASGIGVADGYFLVQPPMAHAGAGSLSVVADPFTTVVANLTTLARNQVSIWLLDVWGQQTALAASAAAVGVSFPAIPGGTGSDDARTAAAFEANASFTLSNRDASAGVLTLNRTTMQNVLRMPVLLPPTTVLTFRSTATGANTITLTALCWAGVKGSRPPGMY